TRSPAALLGLFFQLASACLTSTSSDACQSSNRASSAEAAAFARSGSESRAHSASASRARVVRAAVRSRNQSAKAQATSRRISSRCGEMSVSRTGSGPLPAQPFIPSAATKGNVAAQRRIKNTRTVASRRGPGGMAPASFMASRPKRCLEPCSLPPGRNLPPRSRVPATFSDRLSPAPVCQREVFKMELLVAVARILEKPLEEIADQPGLDLVSIVLADTSKADQPGHAQPG